MADYLRTADEIATTVVAPDAPRVDKDGTFPAAALDALRAAGLMGLISARDVGGMGEGTRAAVLVVERLARETLQPGVKAEEAADLLARLSLSLMGTPGTWDLDDPAAVRRLVDDQLLAGIVVRSGGGR